MPHLCSDPPIQGSGSPNGACWYNYNDQTGKWEFDHATGLAAGYSCRSTLNEPPPSPGTQQPVAYHACTSSAQAMAPSVLVHRVTHPDGTVEETFAPAPRDTTRRVS